MKNNTKKSKSPSLPNALELFKPSVEALRVNLTTVLFVAIIGTGILLLLTYVVTSIIRIHTGALSVSDITAITLLSIIGLIWAVVNVTTLQMVLLHSAQFKKISYNESLEMGLKFAPRIALVSLFVVFIVLIGFVLLIIPGFFMIKRYFLVTYYLLDNDYSPRQAMRECAADSKRFGLSIWGIMGVEYFISFISLIPIVGSIFSTLLAMLYYCAPAVRYEQIRALSK